MDIGHIAEVRGWPEGIRKPDDILAGFSLEGKSWLTVIMLGAIGDVVCLLSALSAFKSSFPDKNLRLIVEAPIDDMLDCGFIDEVFCLNTQEGRSSISKIDRAAHVVLNLHSTYRSALLAYYLGEENAYGLASDGKNVFIRGHIWQIFFHRVFYPTFLNKRLEDVNILGRTAILGLCLNVFVHGSQKKCLRQGHLPVELPEEYIVVVPDANAQTRIWPIDKYKKLALSILREFEGSKSVVFISKEKQQALKDTNEKGIVDLTGKTDLPQAVHVIANARAVVSNDTGMIHIAGAYNVPTLVVCGPNNVGPEAKGNFLSIRKDVECAPCRNSSCDSMICMERLSVEDVLFSLNRLFELESGQLPHEQAGPGFAGRGLVAGYSYNRDLDLFFDYHPFGLPYTNSAVFGDVLYRYILAFVYIEEIGLSVGIDSLKDYMERYFALPLEEIAERINEIKVFLNKVRTPLLPIIEKIDILIKRGVSSDDVMKALSRVLSEVPDELDYPCSVSMKSAGDYKDVLGRVIQRCDRIEFFLDCLLRAD